MTLFPSILSPPTFPSHSPQNSYHECAEAMLTSYPNEVYPLVQTICSEKIPEVKVLSLMEYLCNTSTYLLAMILGRLSSNASTAGMELLR